MKKIIARIYLALLMLLCVGSLVYGVIIRNEVAIIIVSVFVIYAINLSVFAAIDEATKE